MGLADFCFWLLLYISSLGSTGERGANYELFAVTWIPNAAPKMSVCTLRVLMNKLLNRDFLLYIGVSQTVYCACQRLEQGIICSFLAPFHLIYGPYVR